jgi:hypothetical protein
MDIGEKLARDLFPTFDLIDADDIYFAVRKPGVGRVDATVDELSLEKLSVEKYGERTKLFRGANLRAKALKHVGLSDG